MKNLYQISTNHVFDYNNHFFLINGDELTIQIIGNKEKVRLNSIIKKPNLEITNDELSFLDNIKLLKKNIYSNKNTTSISPLTHITLFVAQTCNLKCTYCYGNEGEYGNAGFMNYETAIKSVDWLIKESKNKKELGISFFGGEPLLNFKLIKKVANYALQQGEKFEKKFEFGITTNGLLLNDENIAFMKKYKIIPVVSFDGPKKIQDKYRVFKNGNGTYDFALKKLKKLLEAIPDSICRATLMDIKDYSYVEKHLNEIGFKFVQLTVATPALFTEKVLHRDIPYILNYIKETSNILIETIKKHNDKNLKKIKYSGLGWHLSRMLEQFVYRQKRYFACGAGRSGVAISTDGNVQLCHRFVGISDFILGNIYQKNIFRSEYQVSPTKVNIDCKSCFAKYFCGGGCYHDNICINGDIYLPAKDMCLFMQNLTQYAGIIFYELDNSDIEYIIQKKFINKQICLLDIF